MDLLIYYVDDPSDYFGRCIYINDKLYTAKRPIPPYREGFWLDLINDYISAYSISEVDNIKIIRTCIEFWNGSELENFSDYPAERFYHPESNEIIENGTLEQIRKKFYSNPKNRKQYVLIRRDGRYYSNDGKFYKDLSKAKKDSYENLENIVDIKKSYEYSGDGYDMWNAGIMPYDRMKYLEDTYRSKSNSYFANVFNKCCKHKYLKCWK